MISVQESDFSVAEEYEALRQSSGGKNGAIATFTGLVRDYGDKSDVQGMFLEHYPGMTEKVLLGLVDQARVRWNINSVRIIHRVGSLSLDEQIVFVGVCAAHRTDAFESCQFLMDFLKTKAPFWKKEINQSGEHWVEAKASDESQAGKWL